MTDTEFASHAAGQLKNIDLDDMTDLELNLASHLVSMDLLKRQTKGYDVPFVQV